MSGREYTGQEVADILSAFIGRRIYVNHVCWYAENWIDKEAGSGKRVYSFGEVLALGQRLLLDSSVKKLTRAIDEVDRKNARATEAANNTSANEGKHTAGRGENPRDAAINLGHDDEAARDGDIACPVTYGTGGQRYKGDCGFCAYYNCKRNPLYGQAQIVSNDTDSKGGVDNA